MKHGPIALIDENMPVVFIAPRDAVHSKIVSNIEEVKARGGKVIALINAGDTEIERLADATFAIPETLDMLTPILTSIPLQLDFIRGRKGKCQTHFAQIIRLAKWWAKQRERDTDGFQLRSFAIELIMAKLLDQGKKFDDYHVGLEHFFSYIQKTGLRERIAFADHYPASSLPTTRLGIVEIYALYAGPAFFCCLISARGQRLGDSNAQSPGRLRIDHQLQLCWLFDRKISRPCAFQNSVHVHRGAAISISNVNSIRRNDASLSQRANSAYSRNAMFDGKICDLLGAGNKDGVHEN